MITLFNTLTGQKEEFKPLKGGEVKMYVCGPTVYDVPHIGHARSAYIFEIVRRHFEHLGFNVFFVRNVTDVDDKIIKKAADELAETGKEVSSVSLKKRAEEVARRYLDYYHDEMDILNVRPPTVEPKATENIPQMIKFINDLIEKEYAYVASGSVYFSVEKFADYGKLSNQDKDHMMHGSRIEMDRRKRYPLDFALWKQVKPLEPSWESPWGKGRPGWHIECSVMSTGILGKQFDIHGGGLDLVFPHHENEIAQAEAVTGTTFANYWIHNGLLSVNGEKMSKSLRNYIKVSDFLEKHKDPDLLKIVFLNSHYRNPMDYSDEKIGEAGHSKERIMIFMDRADRIMCDCSFAGQGGSEVSDSAAVENAKKIAQRLKNKFDEAMNDDFNTPIALSVIFEAVRIGNECISDDAVSFEGKTRTVGAIKSCILKFADILCLSLNPVHVDKKETEEIDELVARREKARRDKDYAEADRVRDELTEKGVVVEDTPEGPVWRKN